MSTDLLVAPTPSVLPDSVPSHRPPPGRRRWALGAAMLILAGAGFGVLVRNEQATNTQFDATQQRLVTTVEHLHLEHSDQAALQKDVDTIQDQATDASNSLSQLTAQLQSVEASLTHVQSDVSQQGTSIVGLQDCLGGVEQALNAVSVGDQRSAVAALNAVQASCQSAVAASG